MVSSEDNDINVCANLLCILPCTAHTKGSASLGRPPAAVELDNLVLYFSRLLIFYSSLGVVS